jgi:spore coat polysaccharide biosynthesis protein SpsF
MVAKPVQVIAIIIARLTSSRLPQKHLRHLNGLPLLHHVIKRLRYSKRIDQVVIATGAKSENRDLVEYALSLGVESFFDEDVNDVTGRVAKAGSYFHADYILTISGDCPLVDPLFVSEGIELLLSSDGDYIFVDHAKNDCLHEGIGFFKQSAWQKLDEVSTTWFQKEHPGSILKEQPELLKGIEITPHIDFQRHDFRMSIDTLADLNFMNEIYHELDRKHHIVDLHKVVQLVDQKPWLKKLNGHVHQKAVTEISKTIMFITHASKKIGMGHISRSIALATEMQEALGEKTIFYVNSDDKVSDILDRHGIHYYLSDQFGECSEIKSLISQYKFNGIVIDLKKEELHNSFEFIPKLSVPSILIDNRPEGPFNNLLSIIPAVQVDDKKEPKNIKKGKDFLILKRELQYWREIIDLPSPDGLLVMSGGSGLPDENLLYALKELGKSIIITFIIGPFAKKDALEQRINQIGIVNYKLKQSPKHLLKELKRSKLVILTFGVSVYECLALGIPALVYNILNPDDEKIVEHLSREKILFNGLKIHTNPLTFGNHILDVYSNKTELNKIAKNATEYIDGLGVCRVANIVNRHFDL